MRSFRAHRAEWSDEIWLLIVEEDHENKIAGYVCEMTFREHKRGEPIREPSLRMPAQAAQRLMDELWRVGVRPSNGESNAGQLGALERHLEDMRKLVFEEPKVRLVEASPR